MEKGYFYIAFAAFCWGIIGIFTKVLSALGFSGMQLCFLRSVVPTIVVFIYLFFTKRELLKIRPRDWWMFAGIGVLGFYMLNYSYFMSISLVGVSVAAVLLYTSPIFVMIFSAILFKEKITGQKLGALLFCLAGSFLVSGIFSSSVMKIPFAGFCFGILSALSYAVYSIFTVIALKKYNTLTISFYTFFFSAVVSVFSCNPAETILMASDFSVLFFALALGIVSGAIPTISFATGLKTLEASKAAIVATLEPVIAAAVGIVIFKESADVFTYLGIFFVVLSAVILNLKKNR